MFKIIAEKLNCEIYDNIFLSVSYEGGCKKKRLFYVVSVNELKNNETVNHKTVSNRIRFVNEDDVVLYKEDYNNSILDIPIYLMYMKRSNKKEGD